MVPGKPAMIASSAGNGKASGPRSCRSFRPRRTRTAPWSGATAPSTAASSAPTSTQRGRRHGARGRKKGEAALAREALGYSRGGFSTKQHLAFDGRGRPLALVLTGGQRHESPQLGAVLDGIRVPRRRGRPRKRPDDLALDRGYSYQRCRRLLRRRKLRHVIPERRAKGSRGGRPPRYERAAYRQRSWAERGVNRLKQWRAVATRYDKRAACYLATVQFAAIMIWLQP